MIGQKLAHYRITAAIGAGGMGEVYRATDTRLGRDVALKVLPPEMASMPERLDRFRREAKALAALDHPGIVTVYSVEEADGVHFLTMQLVEGQSLDRVVGEGVLSIDRILSIAAALAEAIAAAHDKGIIHRDLKPANVMVSADGRVKVLDFGLARMSITEPAGDSQLPTDLRTRDGVVMGTAAYMSPEQITGRELDHRTDIFSLGIILYEMTSGRRPFNGRSSAELASAILRDTPRSLGELRGGLPESLQRAIERCLEKSAANRFSSARELYEALRASRGASSSLETAVTPTVRTQSGDSGGIRSEEGFWVAVLPFKYTGADADLAALREGLPEEIVTGLSRFRYLSVVASSSAGRVAGVGGDERTLGTKPGARYVVEGSIRGGGSAVRVSAQLVDTQTGAQLWSETYRRDLETSSDFAVQEDIAARIVATVADSYGVLVHSMRDAMRKKDDANLTPAEWQFQYFAYREQITPANHAALKSRLERVAEQVDRQSDLWACLAQVYVDEYAFGFPGHDGKSLDRALAAARRGVELDRANQFAMVALAQTHFFRQDLAAFGPAAARAMALNPLNTDALGILGLEIVHTGEFERGTAIVRRAMELNANHAGWMHFAPLWDHFHKQEYEQALECANRVDVPGLFWPFLVMASACGHLGRSAEAKAAVRDLLALDPEFAAHARSNIASWHFASGLLEPLLEGLRKAGLDVPSTDGSSDSPTRIETVAAGTDRAKSGTDSGQVRADEGFWVAVLPFKYGGANADLAALADGLSADIVTGLSRFSYLRVIARSSSSHYVNEAIDVRAAGRELGARYVMEGNLWQAGGRLRLAVQLVDAVSGAHLWAEKYERTFSPEAVFELQDDLVPRIVATVADMSGVLPHSISEMLRRKGPDQLSPYEAVLRSFGYYERITPEEHATVTELLERAVDNAPEQADCWAMLSMMYKDEHTHGFNIRPDPLGRALTAAHRAVEAAPSNHLGHHALATALFFRRELAAFRHSAERTIALNPMDGGTTAFVGHLMAYAGDWERGCALVEHARQLNPNHPGWYWFPAYFDAYRKRDYRGALEAALKINMPGYFYASAVIAAAYAQLGEGEAARAAMLQLLARKPDFAAAAREELGKWFGPGELLEHFLDGLRKAGLEIAPLEGTAAPARDLTRSSAADSGAARAEEGFWVAVLPFKYSGGNADLTALAEGLSEEIVTGLSRFAYLHVVARGSTLRFTSEATDIRTVGKELGARYVMEGSLRQAGSLLRVSVQLLDASSGAHLWAETYDRSFRPEEIFSLQDELVPRIVSTVADQHGVLVHGMAEVLRNKPVKQLTPYEAVLSVFGFHERMSAEEHAVLRDVLERVVRDYPDQGNCWAMLETLYCDEYMFGFNLRPDPLGRALVAAQRAVEAAPTSNLACQALAQALFFRHEFAAFRPLAERTIALNPMDGAAVAIMGILIACSGEWDRGCEVAEDAMQLNPHFAGWYRLASLFNAYRQRDYRAAVEIALRINIPGYFWTLVMSAAAHGQLGELAAAQRALRELLSTRPDFASTVRAELGGWFAEELVEHVIDGLRMAGLEDPTAKAESHSLESSTPAEISGEVRAEEGFWVAVLPFKYSGDNTDLTALAEGLSEEIVTGLSRFSYLRVIARSSTARYANESIDVRSAGTNLGARYVMEGSLRHAGTKLRLAVQLVDAVSGAHLWAENYERTFNAESVFELQDDLVPRIVATIADIHGVLAQSMSGAMRSRAPETLTPYEAVLRSFGYLALINAEEHGEVRAALERAVEAAPGNSDALAMVSTLYADEYKQGFNAKPDPLGRALDTARRAVANAPSNHLAYHALAQAHFFRKELPAFRVAADRALALNPMDAFTTAYIGILLAYAGDWERGVRLTERAMGLNPNHPGWYRFVFFNDALRREDYREALEVALNFNMPTYFFTHAALATAYGLLGDLAAARNALRELLAQKPDFHLDVREELGKWLDPDLLERNLEGLRKAGLEIPV